MLPYLLWISIVFSSGAETFLFLYLLEKREVLLYSFYWSLEGNPLFRYLVLEVFILRVLVATFLGGKGRPLWASLGKMALVLFLGAPLGLALFYFELLREERSL